MGSKILFLYLKTGGGHLAPAKAVSSWVQANSIQDVEIDLYDGFTGVSPIVKHTIEDGYRISQSRFKIIFEALYAINKFKPIAKLTSWIISKVVMANLEKYILSASPSKIVIFHFFLIKPTLKILRKHKLTTPVVTVITDPFTAHPIWFLERPKSIIVFSNKLKRELIDNKGYDDSSVLVFPFTVNPKFSAPATIQQQLAVRAYLGIENSSRVILILGGADGIPNGEKLLKAFAKSGIENPIVLVCGKSKYLKRIAQTIKVDYNFNNLHILGYIDFVYELISIADVVVTKCGASTFMEVLLCGKIPLVNSYIWEQEKGNVDFICEKGLGIFESNPKRLVEIVKLMVNNPSFQIPFLRNIKNIGLKNGTSAVSDYIIKNENKHESSGNIRLAY